MLGKNIFNSLYFKYGINNLVNWNNVKLYSIISNNFDYIQSINNGNINIYNLNVDIDIDELINKSIETYKFNIIKSTFDNYIKNNLILVITKAIKISGIYGYINIMSVLNENIYDNTILIFAIAFGDTNLVKYIIKLNVDKINYLNNLFVHTIDIQNINMFKLLLTYVNKSQLNWNELIDETAQSLNIFIFNEIYILAPPDSIYPLTLYTNVKKLNNSKFSKYVADLLISEYNDIPSISKKQKELENRKI